MNRQIKRILSIALAGMLAVSAAACGKEQQKFSPNYSPETDYKLSVAGTYSNFESLE